MSSESRHWWNEEYVVFIATDLRKLNAELRSADENPAWYPGYLTRTPWAGPEANEFAAVDFEDLPHMAKVVMVSGLDGYDATSMDSYAEEFHQVTKLFYNAIKRQVTR
jgi:hypothetical protein